MRAGRLILSAKAGIAAATGSQTMPSADAGYVGVWVVTVANGQATITSTSISAAPGAPFFATLPALMAGFAASASQSASIAANTAVLAGAFDDQDSMQLVASNLAAGVSQTIACFGDSTMYGINAANLSTQVATPPPAQLQSFLNTFFGNTAAAVVNSALSGTTAAQMLAGTDGSGQTFAQRIAASSAQAVYCNHGINDAYGPNSTTVSVYKANILSIIKITRAANKVPVLVTPHPCLTIGTFGSTARAEATARFAQAMREVARQHNVILVDNFQMFALILGMDGQMPLSIFPDGAHGPQSTYTISGNNLADAVLGAQIQTLTVPNQRLTATSAMVRATNQINNPSGSSRLGVAVTTSTGGAQSLRVVFRVAAQGLDVSLLHPVFFSGANDISMTFDGNSMTGISPFSMYSAGFPNTNFVQDMETLILRNVAPGLHILSMTTAGGGGGGIGIHGLRSRAAEKPLLLLNASTVPTQRVLLAPMIDMSATVSNTVALFDTMNMSRYLGACEFEWTGQLQYNSGICIGSNIGSNTGSAIAQQLQIFGLNSSGFASVYEATGPAAFVAGTLGSTDLSLAIHSYRVQISAGSPGVVTMYVDNVQVGTYTLTQTYFGGLLGIWKNSAAGVLVITNVNRVWRP